MSGRYQGQDTKALNPNLVAFILIVSFVVIGGIISAFSPILPSESQVPDGREVAVGAPTATPMPTNTPQLPTMTQTSASTAIPIASPTAMPTTMPTATSTAAPVVAVMEPAGSADLASSYDPALVAQGQQLFITCSGCHGPDAHGLPNLGKDLVNSEFVLSMNDQDLLTFIKTGRPIWDTLNTTGVDMPARGGNPTLTDDDLLAIVAYLRSLTAESS